MVKKMDIKLTIMAAGAFFICYFFPFPGVHCADFPDLNATYSGINGSSQPSSSFAKSEDFYDLPSRGFYKNSLTPRFSWVNFFAAKLIENRDAFPWNTPTPIEEDRFDQIGGMQYELYEGEFQHVDYIRQDIVKDLVPRAAEELLKKTRTGRKLDLLSRKIASYCTVQYLKTEDEGSEFHLPGHLSTETSDNFRDLYGTSLSVRLFNDVNSNPLEYALEMNSFYLTTVARLRYEPADKKVFFSLTDLRIEEILGCRTAFEFGSDSSETYGVINVYFNF